jgi:hypothetical protein
MTKKCASAVAVLCLVAVGWQVNAQQTPEWGSGVAPFALALIGDMPYGAVRETPFTRLVAEINRDNDVDFVMHAGDNEWTDCHRVNNGQYNPLERLDYLRSVFFPQIGQTTGGQTRPVRSQAEGAAYPEFVENVMFQKHQKVVRSNL